MALALTGILGACGDDAGSGSLTGPVPPQAPQLTAILDVQNNVALAWNQVTGAVRYRVDRRVSGDGQFEELVNNVEDTRFTDTSVVLGTTYEYVVVANGNGGSSEPSGVVSITVQ